MDAKKKKRMTQAASKASQLVRSGKAQVNWQKLSRTTLNQIVSDAQGVSSKKDKEAAAKAAAELARRSSK